MTEHTLLVVEEDVDESPETYSVTLLEHPPDSAQVDSVQEAMEELREEVASQTGTDHRLVTKSGDPETIETEYAMRTAAAEKAADGDVLTDGGVGENEATDNQNPRTVSVCWAGGMNELGDALLHRRDDEKACGNQPDTHLGTDLETAAVEDGNELCPACECPDGCEAVLAGEYMATDGGVDQDDGEIDRCTDGVDRLSGNAACMENKAAIKKCREKDKSVRGYCNRTWQESLTQKFARFVGDSQTVSRLKPFLVKARQKPSLSAGTANHGFVRTEGVPQRTGRRGRRVSRRGLYEAIQGRNERFGQPRNEQTSPRKLAGSILRRRVGFFSLIGGCSDLSVCSDTRRSAGGDGRAK